MIRLPRAALVAAVLAPLLLAGCGYKGPLYLPEPGAAAPAAPPVDPLTAPKDEPQD